MSERMDRIVNRLSSLDWGSIEHAERHCRSALEELSRPGALRELLTGVRTDRRLLGLSERHSWGDRLVLWDDPVNQWRVRLHRFEDQVDDPHSHQWPFHTLILHGSYRHMLFGTERSVRLAMENSGALPRPSLVRTESVGSSYAIDDQMVHVVKTRADTVSVVIQGPRLKDQALRVRDGCIVPPDGRTAPTLAQIRSVRTSSERIGEIAELAHRLGLIDAVRV
jgi:hypothetical protein